jgi:LPXTG-site transpeptidase (sortase) family protein
MFSKIPLFSRVMPFYAIVALFFLIPIVRSDQNFKMASAAGQQLETQLQTTPVNPPAIVGTEPVRVVIPDIGVDVSVVPGTVDNATKTWRVARGAANYATGSATPNNAGTGKTFIYGHRIHNVFARLSELQKGQVVYVTTSDGHVFKYTARDFLVAKPTDTTVLADIPHGQGLILMTCTGPWDSERYMVYLDLVEAS